MKLIQVGDQAPNFSVKDQHNNSVTLSEFRGSKVLLSFHPIAWTPVCTDQMRGLENNLDKFKKLNTIPLGFSVDSVPCKKAWSVAIQVMNTILPADFWPHGKVAQDYGIFIENEGISERASIIIDENGIVKWVKVYPMKQLPDINEIIQVLEGMH